MKPAKYYMGMAAAAIAALMEACIPVTAPGVEYSYNFKGRAESTYLQSVRVEGETYQGGFVFRNYWLDNNNGGQTGYLVTNYLNACPPKVLEEIVNKARANDLEVEFSARKRNWSARADLNECPKLK